MNDIKQELNISRDSVDLLENWKKLYLQKPPSFEEFCKDIKIYKPKHKWQKHLPVCILKLFVKPMILTNVKLKSIEPLSLNKDYISQSVCFEYEEFK